MYIYLLICTYIREIGADEPVDFLFNFRTIDPRNFVKVIGTLVKVVSTLARYIANLYTQVYKLCAKSLDRIHAYFLIFNIFSRSTPNKFVSLNYRIFEIFIVATVHSISPRREREFNYGSAILLALCEL